MEALKSIFSNAESGETPLDLHHDEVALTEVFTEIRKSASVSPT